MNGDPTVLLSAWGRQLLARLAALDDGTAGELALAVRLRREYPADLVAAAMAQHDLPLELVPAGWEAEFIADGRDLKEAVLWSPALAAPKIAFLAVRTSARRSRGPCGWWTPLRGTRSGSRTGCATSAWAPPTCGDAVWLGTWTRFTAGSSSPGRTAPP